MRLVFVVLLLVLAACGQRPADGPAGAAPAGDSAPDPLRGKTFVTTTVTEDGTERELVAELSVEFTEDGRLIARAGCNIMQAPVDTEGGKLVLDGGLSTTEMGCDQARHEQDSFVGSVLNASPSWRLSGDRLTITSGTTAFDLASREAVDPDRELTGTTWVLDTVLDGEVASSTTSGAPEVTLVFDGKQVTADTHCNGVLAEYTLSGDRIVFASGAMTKMACDPEIMRGEYAVAAVLDGEATFEITADRLTLKNSSGKGIQLHAK